MAEGPDLGIRQPREERDHVIHEVLVVDDAVLALLHQGGHEVAEVGPELLPLLACLDQRVLAGFLGRAGTGGGGGGVRTRDESACG